MKAYLYDPIGAQGARGQGALPGRVPWLRRADEPAGRQGGRVRILQALPSRGDRAAMDPRAGREAMRAWRARYGAAPSSYDWSRTHARRRGGEALKRLQAGEWPAPSTVIDLYGSWAAALADAFSGA